jgi:hypothetical protein
MGSEKRELTPADCVARLPEPTLNPAGELPTEDLRRIELRQSILAIAELNHVNETALVRAVVMNVRDEVPTIEE